MRNFIFLISFLLLAGCASDEQDIQLTPDFAEYVKAAALTWNDAWESGDADAIANQYANDAMLMPPAGDPIVGRPAIHEYWAMGMTLGSSSITSVESGSNGDVAFERGTYASLGPDGEQLDHGKFIVVWKLVDGEWKMYRDIWNSSVPVDAEASASE